MIHPQPTTMLLLLAGPAKARIPDDAEPVIRFRRRSWNAALQRTAWVLRWRRAHHDSAGPFVAAPEPGFPAHVRGERVDGGGRSGVAPSGAARRLQHHTACRSKTTPVPGHALRRHP